MKRQSSVGLLLAMIMAPAMAWGQTVYKCIDAEGAVSFSQSQCPEADEETRLNLDTGSASVEVGDTSDWPTLDALQELGPVEGLKRSRPFLQAANEAAGECLAHTDERPDLDHEACARMQRAHEFVFVYADFGDQISSGQIAVAEADLRAVDRLGRANRSTVEQFNAAVETIRARLPATGG